MAVFNYYRFTPCCGGHPVILTQGSVIFPDISKVHQYTGVDWIGAGGWVLENGQCYTVVLFPANYENIIPDCPPIENFIETPYEECDNDDPLNVCGDCEQPPQPIFSCLCSTVTNTSTEPFLVGYKYIDCNGVNQGVEVGPGETSPKLCVREWTFDPSLNGIIQFYGDCIDNVCPPLFLLTDCSNSENTLCSNSISLQDYFYNGSTVVIDGYPDICWTIEEIEDCPNPIVVNVTGSFRGCLECLSTSQVNYLLLNCETQAVIYTSTDLFEYVGRVVSLIGYTDDCWQVIALDSGIPSDAPVEVDEVFPNCIDCTSTYYLLEDCNPSSVTQPIVTITDLSQYVGQVIRLKTCSEICWTVSETDYASNYQTVLLENSYETCENCIQDLTSKCVSFYNNTETSLGVDYILSTGQSNKLNLLPGESIERICLLTWNISEGVTVFVSGDCVNGECFPEPIRRKRKVTPGYNTPVCSTEYYERVVCNFSEWMYKDVLEKRYGISNCCPEELLKWQIKHEMLMLDVLVNPDYNCTPINTCDCPVIGGVTLNTACLEVTNYILERCNEPEITEVVRIDNQYDVLGNVIVIDELCYTVTAPTNRLVTVYWTPGIIYETCEDAGCPGTPIQLPCEDCIKINATPTGGTPIEIVVPVTGTYQNGTSYYFFTIDNIDYEIYNETWNTTDPPGAWLLYAYDSQDDIGALRSSTCPIGTYSGVAPDYFESFVVDYCGGIPTGFVLYSVFLDTGGLTGVYFTYPDCNNVIQQYNLQPAKNTTIALVCSTPGRLPTDFSAFGGTDFSVVETIIPCNC